MGTWGGEKLVFHPVAYDCPSNNELTHRLLTFFPQDVPNGFRISHLTAEIFLSTGENEPVPCRQMLSMSKLAAKGTRKEIQVVLDWLLDTRRLILVLPQDKYLAM